MQVIYSFNLTQGTNKNCVQINNISYKQYNYILYSSTNKYNFTGQQYIVWLGHSKK